MHLHANDAWELAVAVPPANAGAIHSVVFAGFSAISVACTGSKTLNVAPLLRLITTLVAKKYSGKGYCRRALALGCDSRAFCNGPLSTKTRVKKWP